MKDIVSKNTLKPISHAATYELVVDQILRAIVIRRFQAGDKLPSERLMSEQLGVSRATVREAIRILQAKDVVEVKKGATGGAFVKKYAVESQLKNSANPLEELRQAYEFRLAIETNAARLAAKRRTREELDELRELVKNMDIAHKDAMQGENNGEDAIKLFNALDTQFHLLIARASKVQGFETSVENIRSNLFGPLGSIYGDMRDNANDFHLQIFDAIRKKQMNEAEKVMGQHITETYKDLRKLFKQDPEKAS